jgi:hypothetical protein
MCYAMAKRSEVVAANPGMRPCDVTRTLGQLWRAETDREPYEALALKDKQRYDKERAAQPVVVVPQAPKRPRSAYLFYSNEQRPIILQQKPELTPTEVMRALGVAWNAESAETKVLYTAMAEQDKLRYAAEIATYVPPSPVSKKVDTKKRDASPVRTTVTKSKPKASAFSLFCKAERAQVKAALGDLANLGTVSKELGARWKALDEAQRALFIVQAALVVQV